MATKIKLRFPIDVDGKTISEVTIRRPRGKDMIALGDHFAAVARFENAGDGAVPDAAAFRAMVAIVGTLADLGEDAAGELDMVDLTEVMTKGFADVGKSSQGRGKSEIGSEQ